MTFSIHEQSQYAANHTGNGPLLVQGIGPGVRDALIAYSSDKKVLSLDNKKNRDRLENLRSVIDLVFDVRYLKKKTVTTTATAVIRSDRL